MINPVTTGKRDARILRNELPLNEHQLKKLRDPLHCGADSRFS